MMIGCSVPGVGFRHSATNRESSACPTGDGPGRGRLVTGIVQLQRRTRMSRSQVIYDCRFIRAKGPIAVAEIDRPGRVEAARPPHEFSIQIVRKGAANVAAPGAQVERPEK